MSFLRSLGPLGFLCSLTFFEIYISSVLSSDSLEPELDRNLNRTLRSVHGSPISPEPDPQSSSRFKERGWKTGLNRTLTSLAVIDLCLELHSGCCAACQAAEILFGACYSWGLGGFKYFCRQPTSAAEVMVPAKYSTAGISVLKNPFPFWVIAHLCDQFPKTGWRQG